VENSCESVQMKMNTAYNDYCVEITRLGHFAVELLVSLYSCVGNAFGTGFGGFLMLARSEWVWVLRS